MTVSVQKKVRQTIAARRIRLSSSREIFLIEIENRSFVQESIYVLRQSLRALRSNQFIKTEAPQRFDSACNLRGTGGAGWNRTHVWVLQAEHVLRLSFFPLHRPSKKYCIETVESCILAKLTQSLWRDSGEFLDSAH